MKKLLTLTAALMIGFATFAQVGIGTQNPHGSAMLDVESTAKGFLPPRLSTSQRDAIINPAEGLTIYNSDVKCLQWYVGNAWHCGCGDNPYQAYPSGTVFCNGLVADVVDVTNPVTGRTWMDRNLGASRAATSSTDFEAYGDLYQWGRAADGHQCRNSATTPTLWDATTSGLESPDHGDFIINDASPWDWRSPQNDNLWQGVNGINNPCPSGYRLPTFSELDSERLSWAPNNNAAGAFASSLKLPVSGFRNNANGSLGSVDLSGYYWASTFASADSRHLYFSSSNAGMSRNRRAYGFSVRCIKD